MAGDTRHRNRRTLIILLGVSLGMFGFGFALVPLYGLLCQATGVQSVEQRTAQDGRAAVPGNGVVSDRWVTVKFDATVHPDLPWRFEPLQRKLRVHPGALYEVRFLAENLSSRRVTGQALPSLAPWQANDFFNKLECFCFRNQTLDGGERKEMPLRFMVSPDLPQDYQSLTLSYNFLRIGTADSLAAN